MASQCSYREFLFSEICVQLTKPDVKHLAFSQELPPDYLGKDGPEVLLKLESLDKFSESNLTPLAEMMRVIGKYDLGKKVEKYAKLKKKQQKQSKKKPASNDLMMKQCQITSNSNMAQLLLKIASDQFKEMQTTATEIGNYKVAGEAASAVSVIDQQLLGKLSQISVLLAKGMRHSRNSDSSLETMSSSGSLENSYEIVPSPLAVSHSPQQVEDPEEHNYDYIEHQLQPRVYRRTLEEQRGIGQLVIGKDGLRPSKSKPPVAPKPKPKPRAISTDRNSVVPAPEESSTCTDDSGFEDATKFRKDCSPPKPPPRRPRYQPMQAENREPVGYYTTVANPGPGVADSEALYDEPMRPGPKAPAEPIYINQCHTAVHNKRHSSVY